MPVIYDGVGGWGRGVSACVCMRGGVATEGQQKGGKGSLKNKDAVKGERQVVKA